MAWVGKRGVLLSVFAAVLVWGLQNSPAPTLSPQLREWKQSGKFFSHGEFKVFYHDEAGKGRVNDVVLCIHGFPTSSHDWLKVWGGLQGRFGRVIASDLLGFGLSDKPLDHDYSIFEQASIIERLLVTLEVKEVYILSHDYGDTVALELLRRFLDRQKSSDKSAAQLKIRSVCLMNGGFLPETITFQWGQYLLTTSLGPYLSRLSSLFSFSFRRGISKVYGPDTKPSPAEFDDMRTLLRWNDGHLALGSISQYQNERVAHRERWVEAVQQSTVPVHLIYGPADPVNTPVLLDRYRELFPRATDTVLNNKIGHYPHVEDPESVLTALFNFLDYVDQYSTAGKT
ncbi:mesoderm-specific transcript homolog protein-like [Branchiostoma lanceolatum]|uniref:mesoderm-specific transcript homolog protein-like n=1 Tax=Branchiostoma lanceolatum TaxID=7740 RepID=UPI0034544BAD